jgi:hypothetical protein
MAQRITTTAHNHLEDAARCIRSALASLQMAHRAAVHETTSAGEREDDAGAYHAFLEQRAAEEAQAHVVQALAVLPRAVRS